MAAKLVFFGNERLATGVTTTSPVLTALIEAGYDIGTVVVAQSESGPSRKGRRLEVAEVAGKHGIPVISPANLKEPSAIKQIAEHGAEAAVLVAYGKIVPQDILDAFPRGIINIHPSLLPRHRGSTPIESAILQDESETGVSLMQLVAKMDAGPVYAQETVLMHGEEDKQTLASQLSVIGRDMLINYLPQILDGSLKPTKQNDDEATYDKLIKKSDAKLDVEKKSAIVLAREVRAFAAWPRSRIMLGTSEVIVTRAHAADIKGMPGVLWLSDRQLGVHCKEGTLIIDALIPAGKKEMPASSFLAGYHPSV